MKNTATPIAPLEKNVVLVGAGNAHLVFVRRFGMKPPPGVAVTLVNETAVVPYSAMVPAHIAEDYRRDEIHIDLVRLCQSAGVRLVTGRVTAIDPQARHVLVAQRAALTYDVLSLGVGSLTSCPPHLLDHQASWFLRPLGKLLANLDLLEERLQKERSPVHLVVVGGGASGCELALAIHKCFTSYPDFQLTLLQGESRLMTQHPMAVGRHFERAFAARGIAGGRRQRPRRRSRAVGDASRADAVAA